jgi:LmbE family N-acetylglucosaminyl deacetylase
MNNLFISPHNDDETLFAAYTLLREKPLVLMVTDGFIQFNRGEPISAKQRREETIGAMQVLDCPVYFAGLRDDMLDEWMLKRLFADFKNFHKVFIPALQGGNPHHDLIHNVAKESFPNTIQYATYSKNEHFTPLKDGLEVKPTDQEYGLKQLALDCYQSQIKLLATYPHFAEARKIRSEWLEK